MLVLTAQSIVLLLLVGGIAAQPALAQSGGSPQVYVVSWGDTVASIASRYGVSMSSIIEANELSEPNRIFAGQRLVIPGIESASPVASDGSHTVASGENLFRISLLYDVSVEALMSANGLSNPDQIRAGQQLVVPNGNTPAVVNPPESGDTPTAQSNGDYIVQPGDTIYGISQKFGVSATALADANNLINPAAIYAGQRLQIPGAATASTAGYSPAEAATAHVVQAGETLTSIATRYGTTSWVLAQVNNLSNPSLLFSGQTLTIPAPNALSSTSDPVRNPNAATGKHIIVDVSDQRTYVYENGQLKWTFVVSTGIPGRATWRGEFRIQNKLPNAYASTWDLQMPYWLGFYWAGPLQNGFHALPILSNGVRLWEGLLGTPASYGCVILSTEDAPLLYDWADIGTPVTVRD
jgi:LysM repeat protein